MSEFAVYGLEGLLLILSFIVGLIWMEWIYSSIKFLKKENKAINKKLLYLERDISVLYKRTPD